MDKMISVMSSYYRWIIDSFFSRSWLKCTFDIFLLVWSFISEISLNHESKTSHAIINDD
jgi:hypothetical protein